ncbi:MAG TPA: bacterioferritin [Rhodospirillaceae bacterium]|nr:bacterioferritin [Rhodospirillaceae bacterium]HAA91213.1 bacterioferritin [Rhodospirillaceae bacterium]HAT36136.1 bacterioferritin [Rhodospirillaceae bacterium]|tara:strand:+ start:788 stop:1270 length:483 start_codon:yes stop_codon:yes gene_type:complete
MRGDAGVLKQLNVILKNELTAINQYFLHARMLRNWGYERLGDKVYEESIGEMKHAEALIERILMLDGLPNLQELGKLRLGEDVPEIFKCDLASETDNQTCLKDAVAACEDVRDFVSREILESILEDTEEHIDWIETQETRIDQAGLPNYLQEHMYDQQGA